jgi:hypothetical protein
MKVIDLVKLLYPTTEIEFFNSKGKSLCFCVGVLDIPADMWHREINQISANEHGTFEILLK